MSSSGRREPLEAYHDARSERDNLHTRFIEWVLLEADRLLVTGLLSFGTFVGLLLLNGVGVIAFVNDDSITRLAGGMIAGTFSIVTLVVTINQLILSREFVSAPESEEKLRGVLSFRDDVAHLSGVPTSPPSPTRLLEVLVATVQRQADGLRDGITDVDEEISEACLEYVAHVQGRADQVEARLPDREAGTFHAILATMRYDEDWQLYAARRLQAEYADRLSADASEALDEMIRTLELFTVAQNHFKTTYLQRELTRFSQLSIYCGVPAVLAAILLGFVYSDFAGPTIAVELLPFVVSALVALVVLPLALLAAFILRTATIARRTAAIGPMLPHMDLESEAMSRMESAEADHDVT